MPLLRNGRAVADDHRSGVPLSEWLTLHDDDSATAGRRVALEPDDDAAALAHVLARDPDALELVTIAFPVYTDGRGYSQARLLRRLGYRAELRATGDVRLDQLLFMLRVGIDGARLQASIEPELLRSMLTRFEHAYQPSYALPGGADEAA